MPLAEFVDWAIAIRSRQGPPEDSQEAVAATTAAARNAQVVALLEEAQMTRREARAGTDLTR